MAPKKKTQIAKRSRIFAKEKRSTNSNGHLASTYSEFFRPYKRYENQLCDEAYPYISLKKKILLSNYEGRGPPKY